MTGSSPKDSEKKNNQRRSSQLGKEYLNNEHMHKTQKKQLADKIVTEIKQKHIQPQPKIFFTLKNLLFWGLALLTLVITSIATGALFFFRSSLREYLFFELPFNHKLRLFIASLPIFWIVILILGFILLFWCFRQTKNGYKTPTIILIAVNIILIIAIGTSRFVARPLRLFDRDMRIPDYMRIHPQQERLWLQPQEGLIGGEIIEKQDPHLIIILLNNETWKLHYTDAEIHSSPNLLMPGNFIRAEGRVVGKNEFMAEKIFPSFRFNPSKKPEGNFYHMDKKRGRRKK